VSGASAGLLHRVFDTAASLREEALRRRDEAAYTPEDATLWDDRAAVATETCKEAQTELARSHGLKTKLDFERIERQRPAPAPPPKVLTKFAREAVQRREAAAVPSPPGQSATRTTEAGSGLTYRQKQRLIHDDVVSRAQDMRAARSARYSIANKTGRAAENTTGKFAGISARGILSALFALFKLFELFPAKPPSPEQQKRNNRAAKEKQERQREADRIDERTQEILRQMSRDDQERDRRRRERGGRDDDYGGRERER
jgi:hypothetical protein